MNGPLTSCSMQVSSSKTSRKDCTIQRSPKQSKLFDAPSHNYNDDNGDFTVADPTLLYLFKERNRRLAEFDTRSPDDTPLYLLALQLTECAKDNTPLYLLASRRMEHDTNVTLISSLTSSNEMAD